MDIVTALPPVVALLLQILLALKDINCAGKIIDDYKFELRDGHAQLKQWSNLTGQTEAIGSESAEAVKRALDRYAKELETVKKTVDAAKKCQASYGRIVAGGLMLLKKGELLGSIERLSKTRTSLDSWLIAISARYIQPLSH
jgi:hypothetical protein